MYLNSWGAKMSKSASRHSPVQRVSEVPNYWRTCSAGLVT